MRCCISFVMEHALAEIERQLGYYLEGEMERLGVDNLVKLVRDVHPRDPTVVILRLVTSSGEHIRYMALDPEYGLPIPHFTEEDPQPLDA